jgi:hypothetical protein
MWFQTRFHQQHSLPVVFVSLLLFNSCATAQHSHEFRKIFDGRTLNGWKGDSSVWSIVNNSIIGQTTEQHPLKANTFILYSANEPGDFEFKAEYRISATGNSGVQYRSELFESMPFVLKGYQADIDGNNEYTGQNYEERGRAFLAKRGEIAVLESGKQPIVTSMIANADSLRSLIKSNDWNEIRIIAKGNRLRHFINGVLMSDVTDNDTALRKMKGILGFQIHAGHPMKVEYRNIYLKE